MLDSAPGESGAAAGVAPICPDPGPGPSLVGTPNGLAPQLGTLALGDHQCAVMALKAQLTAPGGGHRGRCAGLGLALDAVVARAARHQAAFIGQHLPRQLRAGLTPGQMQRQRARLQSQHPADLVELLHAQVGVSAQTHRVRAQPQLGPRARPGAQQVAGHHRPVAQRLLHRAQPHRVVAVVPAHFTRHSVELADNGRELARAPCQGLSQHRRGTGQYEQRKNQQRPAPGKRRRTRHGP